MILAIGFLTFVMVLNCVFLVLLVLIQLPKKEAGAGVAFGASATDALFGAGKGNALTNATKYAASTFVGLAIVLSMMYSRLSTATERGIDRAVDEQAAKTPAVAPLAGGTNATTRTITNVFGATNTGATPVITPSPAVPAAAPGTPALTVPQNAAPPSTANPAGTPATPQPTPDAPGATPAPAPAPATPPQQTPNP